MTRNTIIVIFIFLFTSNTYSQTKGTEVSIGTKYSINSSVLNQEREVYIYLPDSYDSSDEQYATLYILDGQWYFANGVAIQKALRTPDHLPEMIVVGIKNKNPLRRTMFDDEHLNFLSFIETELIDFVDKNFRTNKKRILFGWEDGAYFACSAFFDKSQLFDGVIISDGAQNDKNIISDFNKLNTSEVKYLYMANSEKDIYSIQWTEAFNSFLIENQPNNVKWEYEKFNNEVHESLPYLSMYHGLIYYYHNYPSLVFSSIDDFNKIGGIPYLETYFKERGERFGFPTEIDNSTRNSLIWLALNRDDFKSFDLFMNEFSSVLTTSRYDNAYWQNRLAQFYLKHKDSKNAMAFFMTGIEKYADSDLVPEMYVGLGDAYQLEGKSKLALASYMQALERNSDAPELKEKIRILEKNN